MCVCRAAAKAGKSVLQLDPAGHYGGAWAALTLHEFLSALGRTGEPDGLDAVRSDVASRLSGSCVLRSPGAALGPAAAFNIDLSPHLLYGAGPAISLLLGSGAHHYTEYKLLQGVFVKEAGSAPPQPVPSTRAEVFRDRTLSPLQKRTLMRFLKACTEALQGEGPLKVRSGAD